MIESNVHKFKVPESKDFVIETINNLAETINKIDISLPNRTNSLNTYLKKGTLYNRGIVIYNDAPVVSGYVGWVNVRAGVFAPSWQKGLTFELGDLIIPKPNNGHVYECIENGTSGVVQPAFPSTTNGTVFDHSTSVAWISNKVYELNDIVLATNGNQLYYYKCILAGTSGTIEPDWTLTSGTTVMDGSAQWQTYKAVKWKEVGSSCDFREFGLIN